MRYFVILFASLLTGILHARNPEPLRVASASQKIPPSQIKGYVVLVHGFLEKGLAFSYLKKRLEKQGLVCIVPKLTPCDGRGGLESLAKQLQQEIQTNYGPHRRFSIVAFSMGGLVSRYYLQQLGGAARCNQFVTISSPHHGTKTAFLYPSKGVEQMRPGSDFLANLEKTEANLGKMPITSYRTPFDLMILPATSSVWKRAENKAYNALAHPFMLTSRSLVADLEKRLLTSNEKPNN